MRLGCLIFLFRSQTGRQLDSFAFLAILLRLSPCLTVTFLRFWSVWAATILVWPRWTALTGSADAGSANAEARTAAPRPVTTLRRAVRANWCACMRAKESSSSCTWGWPDGTGRQDPCAATRRAVALPFSGRWPGGAQWGRALLRPYEPWRVEEVRRKRQGGRCDPLVGSRPVALGSSLVPGDGEAGSGIQDDRGRAVGCPACGGPNPGRARFCQACGEPLPLGTARPGGTRKAVTVVFSDLSGSTALGERLDPESLSRVMARYYEAMRAVVRRHGGTVEKFAGDAVMAVFGIPAAHKDDALRAVRAASDMHAALAELNHGLWRQWRVRLELHTGVNTGEVMTGDTGVGSSLVVGDAVNLAARLEQAAGPGQILLGRASWRLVRDAVEVEPPDGPGPPRPPLGRARLPPAGHAAGSGRPDSPPRRPPSSAGPRSCA